jgi:hypothetical protein
LDWVIGGWQLNGIYTLQAGLPFSVCVDGPESEGGSCVTRADIVGPLVTHPGLITPGHYFDTTSFASPPSTTYSGGSNNYDRPGTSGRDILRGPGESNIDLSIFKNFSFTERTKLEVRFQAYNATNTPHFANPNADLSQGSTFGTITQTLPYSYRQCELGLRLTF